MDKEQFANKEIKRLNDERNAKIAKMFEILNGKKKVVVYASGDYFEENYNFIRLGENILEFMKERPQNWKTIRCDCGCNEFYTEPDGFCVAEDSAVCSKCFKVFGELEWKNKTGYWKHFNQFDWRSHIFKIDSDKFYKMFGG